MGPALALSLLALVAPGDSNGAEKPPAVAPSLGLWHELVYHARAGKLLLLNGEPETGTPAQELLELWSLDAQGWSRVAVTSGPRWRNAASAAYDARRGVLVLHGGVQPDADFADTWEFDGAAWKERAVDGGPGAREGAGLAYDAARGEAVLFGGAARGEIRGDTWTWNGERWKKADASGPSPRFPGGFAYGGAGSRVVLCGGHVVDARGFRTLGDTWTWDGTRWTEVVIAGPSARDGARAAEDPRTGRVWLFGGVEVGTATRPLADLWSWDGKAWTKQDATGPAGRAHAAFAFDPRDARFVLAGGSNAPGVVLSDAWSFDGRAWRCAAGCP